MKPSPSAPLGATTSSTVPPLDTLLTPSPEAPPIISGFGSLIEEEHELLTFLSESFHKVRGLHGDSIDRIFENHREQIEIILGLLYKRSDLLPHPVRFDVLKSGAPLLTHAPRPSPAVEPVLRKLIDLHLHLLGGIETLLKMDHEAQREERALSQVAQRHDEMAWMLTALLKEDSRSNGTSELFSIPSGDTTSPLSLDREQTWENDGGATSPSLPA